jgi:hypothetical protein
MASVAAPLSSSRRWGAIAGATLLLAPAVWSLLVGLVSTGAASELEPPAATAGIVIGLALVPVAFAVLAIASQQPHPARAVGRAVGLLLLVGVPVSAVAGDAVTGIVAGVGAGGIVCLRADPTPDWRWRAGSVAIGAAYCYLLARTAGAVVVLAAPIFPFTGLGLADHLADWHRERARALHDGIPPIPE